MGDERGGTCYLPLDLVTLIFLYLPVKSLIRFTCVCKTWFDLIRNDHHFAINHYLTRSTSSSKVLDHVDYISEMNRRSGSPCFYSLTESKTFRLSKKFELVPDIPLRVSNPCHGIICFRHSGSEILLGNPLIQEVVLLPPCPSKGISAIGFDPINHDYKIVAIEFYPCTANVYSVRRGYWRSLPVSASLSYIHLVICFGALNANGRRCNWLFHHSLESRSSDGLLSFDMVEEVFKELSMPKCLFPPKHTHALLSSTRWQACLSCFHDHWYSDIGGISLDVWVLKGSSGSDHCEDWMWSREFVVRHPGHEPMRPLNIWMNDKELLIEKVSSGEVFHYDLAIQQLRRTGRHRVCGCFLRGYAESLISIKSFMSLHGQHVKQSDEQVETFKQEDTDEYQFRKASRKGFRWSSIFKCTQASK